MSENYLTGYPQNDYRLYLAHHGIMGMKWGIRNGPPYPLDFRDHSAVEKKYMSERTYGSSNKSDSKPQTPKDNMDHSKSDKTELYTYLAWLGVDILTLNPYGLAMDIQRGANAAHAEIKTRKVEKIRAQSRVDKKTGLHVKHREFSEKEDMYMVNPSFKNFDKNTKNNCMLCTTAYDMRRRGYEVSAKKASHGYKEADAERWYKNANVKTIEKPRVLSFKEAFLGNKDLTEKVTRELEKQGNGARGNLMISWNTSGGGHSIVYEVQDNKLILRDCQNNQVYKHPGKLIKGAVGASYIRLDNVEPNMKRIKEAVR